MSVSTALPAAGTGNPGSVTASGAPPLGSPAAGESTTGDEPADCDGFELGLSEDTDPDASGPLDAPGFADPVA